MSSRALILGIGGQDGAYLAQLLLQKGYEVHGTSRDVARTPFYGLKRLAIQQDVQLHSVNMTDYGNLLQTLSIIDPSEIYNLSAQSSVGLSFAQPTETLNSIANATLNLLEAIRYLKRDSRLYNASSSEMFGDSDGLPSNEKTFFRPHSPYGIAKSTAHWLVESYRKGYNLFACSGILFNHESPLRNKRFVTKKIVKTAVAIKLGENQRLKLGDLSIVRDWGWAPEYVEAMWIMLQQEIPEDFVIATGKGTSLQDFTSSVFGKLDLDWRAYVEHDPDVIRPYEIKYTVGDASKAAKLMGWTARLMMPEIASKLVEMELARQKTGTTEEI
ncbi:MAG: GDP-mannose 4,6-dehydratase [Cohaesibacteraceae bacterium]|nr:GDP-mannose 4,6-dehydratase [Cohaesibacteraceae bacterium]MBL4876520.1 GDP-mannose 4,6-dehydratase [Cohaesibacteraceae bacterium]